MILNICPLTKKLSIYNFNGIMVILIYLNSERQNNNNKNSEKCI